MSMTIACTILTIIVHDIKDVVVLEENINIWKYLCIYLYIIDIKHILLDSFTSLLFLQDGLNLRELAKEVKRLDIVETIDNVSVEADDMKTSAIVCYGNCKLHPL